MHRRYRKKEGWKQPSMWWRMAGIVGICWMIPLAFMIGIFGVYMASNHSDMTAENFRDQLEFSNKICVERLNGAVAASRQASYDGELLAVHERYLAGILGNFDAGRAYKNYLTDKYLKNDAVSSAILWFETEDVLYSVYNERANGSYQGIRVYETTDHEAVRECAKTLDTRIGFLVCKDRIYLVRNLVDKRYHRQATLVFCLNRDYCFNSLSEYPLAEGVCAQIGGQMLPLRNGEALSEWLGSGEAESRGGYAWVGGRLCVSDIRAGDNYQLHTAMLLQKEVTKYPFYGYPYVLGGMVLSLVPMLLLMLHVFRRQVTDPVEVLSEGARHIEQGELGYQVCVPLANREFTYLRDSMNEMSTHLKQQFDRIYQEEIALREARIMALQSHINPHFMNNTLESINWEARLSGNEKVSKMIGALSTMLDAAMDRRKRPQVRLSEEMGYVNSYLYITGERLGSRLKVEKELPEELMDCMVPRLILQPVIENAVEHGVVPNGSGTVRLLGYCDDTYLYLETINDGGMTEEDRARIERLLDPNYSAGKEPAGNLGIANVNQRLRILFGDPCGLTITEREDGKVVAKLTMPVQK